MGISQYLKEIGRGKDGARSLNREQAADLPVDAIVTQTPIGRRGHDAID